MEGAVGYVEDTSSLSQGVPMMLMGNKYGHTCNSSYGHDTALNHFQRGQGGFAIEIDETVVSLERAS
ncbi:hypothetical protein Tco_0826966 [Tanacetum coccineum]